MNGNTRLTLDFYRRMMTCFVRGRDHAQNWSLTNRKDHTTNFYSLNTAEVCHQHEVCQPAIIQSVTIHQMHAH